MLIQCSRSWCRYHLNAFKTTLTILMNYEIIAVKRSLYVIKHTWIFTERLPQISRLIQIYSGNFLANKLTRMSQDGYKMDRFYTRNSYFIRYI